ncbi:AI-2E family transporter [Caenimonas sedimenti]|uniref:AI-2E family transporter n=2 Tax=Caenimonas sedimenti TaxID=2596921 RepID=A0A562ZKH6_9BURK|nr:AI-2E family transporter [Caenimonas sedimenti]
MLVVLTCIAVLAVLKWASGFFIPLMISLVFSYALSPVVDWLARRKIPRALSAAVLILGILGAAGSSVYALADDANELITSLPAAAAKLRDSVRKQARAPDTTLETVQKAAAELQKAAEEAGGATSAPNARGVARVIIEKPRFDLRDHLVSGTLGLASLLGQIVLVTFLTYFMLMSGDTFRRKLVKITGPGLSEKKLTVQALDEINAQMQRYLVVQLAASVGVGLATGIAFAMLGLNHAAVWGVAAGVLNLVPYMGSLVVTGGASLVAFLQFGQIDMALLVGGISLLINTIEGYLLVPWATSKTSRMNAVAVFIGVLAWGWLWGVWGLLLGIPILMAIKAVCDRVDHLKPVGELLGT